jgi:hypothetical protein
MLLGYQLDLTPRSQASHPSDFFAHRGITDHTLTEFSLY